MSESLKPIKLYGHAGPNPPKVAIMLNELKLPYEVVDVELAKVKGPEYVAVNPNGRIPAIQDPNSGITLWESGAILEYLVERYDKERKFSFEAGTNESFLSKQWLFFQASGQGPYYGQAVFFSKYHSEPLPSAVDRFCKEINRVSGVLESWLAKQKQDNGTSGNGPWLVGDKMTYADISFVPWQLLPTKLFGKDKFDPEEYPLLQDWMGRMMAQKEVKDSLVEFGILS